MSAQLDSQQGHLVTDYDMDNLKRLIWICSSGMPERDRWVSVIWQRLRAVTGKPEGAFEARDIPIMSMEIIRILACSVMTRAITEKVADTMLSSYVADNQKIDQGCVDKISQVISNFDYRNPANDDWQENDIMIFLKRVATIHPTPYNVNEPEY